MPGYTRQHDPWEDSPSTDTPINAAALNGIEQGIERASIPTKVTALPGSPYDGQEVYFEADDANGIFWHLRYRSASASAYKWELLGGVELLAEIATAETTTSAAYVDLATAGPSVTLPLAGDYIVEFGCHIQVNPSTGNRAVFAAVKRGAAATTDADGINHTNDSNRPRNAHFRKMRMNGLAAADVLKMQFKTSGDTAEFNRRFLSVRPVRVS